MKNDIPMSFAQTLNKSNLTSLSIDISELGLDSFLNEGFLKEIPVVKTIAASIKLGHNIQDWLFLKKIVAFLYQIHEINASEREGMIAEIDNSKKFRIRVGEKILYLIDKSDDWINADLVGRLFKLFVCKKIEYKQFTVCSEIISRTSNQELEILKENKGDELDPSKLSSLATSGLFTLEFEEGKIHQEGSPLGTWGPHDTSFRIEDSGVYYKINDYGKIVRSIL